MTGPVAGDMCPGCNETRLVEESLSTMVLIVCRSCNAAVNYYIPKRRGDRKMVKPIEKSKASEICIACQECCRWTTFVLSMPSQMLLDHYKARGFEIKIIGDNFHIMVQTVCPHLKKSGCSIYADRPQVCRNYDGRFDPVMCDRCQLPIE